MSRKTMTAGAAIRNPGKASRTRVAADFPRRGGGGVAVAGGSAVSGGAIMVWLIFEILCRTGSGCGASRTRNRASVRVREEPRVHGVEHLLRGGAADQGLRLRVE